MQRTLLLFGCGGHSRSVADVYLESHPDHQIVFIDKEAKVDEKILGFPVLSLWDGAEVPSFLAIGDNVKRFTMFKQVGSKNLISILSRKAHIAKNSNLQKGCFVGNLSHIGPETDIGINTIVNTGSIIEHEVRIGSHSHIAPGAVICGRSVIGDLVFVGAGAVIRDGIQIASKVVIGAGSTVVKSIAEPGIYVGAPARKIKPFPIEPLSNENAPFFKDGAFFR